MLRKEAESNFSRELGAVVSDWGKTLNPKP